MRFLGITLLCRFLMHLSEGRTILRLAETGGQGRGRRGVTEDQGE